MPKNTQRYMVINTIYMDLMTKLKIVIKIGRQCQNQNHKLIPNAKALKADGFEYSRVHNI